MASASENDRSENVLPNNSSSTPDYSCDLDRFLTNPSFSDEEYSSSAGSSAVRIRPLRAAIRQAKRAAQAEEMAFQKPVFKKKQDHIDPQGYHWDKSSFDKEKLRETRQTFSSFDPVPQLYIDNVPKNLSVPALADILRDITAITGLEVFEHADLSTKGAVVDVDDWDSYGKLLALAPFFSPKGYPNLLLDIQPSQLAADSMTLQADGNFTSEKDVEKCFSGFGCSINTDGVKFRECVGGSKSALISFCHPIGILKVADRYKRGQIWWDLQSVRVQLYQSAVLDINTSSQAISTQHADQSISGTLSDATGGISMANLSLRDRVALKSRESEVTGSPFAASGPSLSPGPPRFSSPGALSGLSPGSGGPDSFSSPPRPNRGLATRQVSPSQQIKPDGIRFAQVQLSSVLSNKPFSGTNPVHQSISQSPPHGGQFQPAPFSPGRIVQVLPAMRTTAPLLPPLRFGQAATMPQPQLRGIGMPPHLDVAEDRFAEPRLPSPLQPTPVTAIANSTQANLTAISSTGASMPHAVNLAFQFSSQQDLYGYAQAPAFSLPSQLVLGASVSREYTPAPQALYTQASAYKPSQLVVSQTDSGRRVANLPGLPSTSPPAEPFQAASQARFGQAAAAGERQWSSMSPQPQFHGAYDQVLHASQHQPSFGGHVAAAAATGDWSNPQLSLSSPRNLFTGSAVFSPPLASGQRNQSEPQAAVVSSSHRSNEPASPGAPGQERSVQIRNVGKISFMSTLESYLESPRSDGGPVGPVVRNGSWAKAKFLHAQDAAGFLAHEKHILEGHELYASPPPPDASDLVLLVEFGPAPKGRHRLEVYLKSVSGSAPKQIGMSAGQPPQALFSFDKKINLAQLKAKMLETPFETDDGDEFAPKPGRVAASDAVRLRKLPPALCQHKDTLMYAVESAEVFKAARASGVSTLVRHVVLNEGAREALVIFKDYHAVPIFLSQPFTFNSVGASHLILANAYYDCIEDFAFD